MANDRETKKDTKPARQKEPLPYYGGLILMAVGVLLVFSSVRVTTMWYSWGFGNWLLPSGVTVLPLLIGIGMFIYRPKWLASKIVMVVGVLFLLLTMVLSVRFTMAHTSLLQYIAMFGCFVVGLALFIRGSFPPKKG